MGAWNSRPTGVGVYTEKPFVHITHIHTDHKKTEVGATRENTVVVLLQHTPQNPKRLNRETFRRHTNSYMQMFCVDGLATRCAQLCSIHSVYDTTVHTYLWGPAVTDLISLSYAVPTHGITDSRSGLIEETSIQVTILETSIQVRYTAICPLSWSRKTRESSHDTTTSTLVRAVTPYHWKKQRQVCTSVTNHTLYSIHHFGTQQ